MQTSRQERIPAAIPAREKLLIKSINARHNSKPKRLLTNTVPAHRNPQSMTGTITTPMIAPKEFGFPNIGTRRTKYEIVDTYVTISHATRSLRKKISGRKVGTARRAPAAPYKKSKNKLTDLSRASCG